MLGRKRLLVLLILLTSSGLTLPISRQAAADEFTSSDFRIQDPVIFAGDYLTSGSYQLYSALFEPGLGTSTAAGFRLNPGFLFFPQVTLPEVTATAGDSQVTLNWTASQGFLGWTVSGYSVGQAVVSGGPYSYTDVGHTLSAVIGSLNNGTTYYFVVEPQDAFANRIATSSEVSAAPVSGGGGGGGGSGGYLIIPPFAFVPPPFRLDCLAGDFNCDGRVNLIDFSILLYYFGKPNPPQLIDLKPDGVIDLLDFSVLAFYWTG